MVRVLVAEDDDAIRETIERGLRAHGYEVAVARDGKEALDLVAEGTFDLVVTDINMPTMDGIELIVELVDQRPGLKVIAMSGGGLVPKDELLSDARLLGAVDILEKPFDLNLLLDRIESALGPT